MEEREANVVMILPDDAEPSDNAMSLDNAEPKDNEMPSDNADKPKIEEITLKFGKGCVGEEFQGKDGNLYKEILIPNPDKDDHRPWQTFVVKSNHVHENQFGKGMWCKLPAEGSTTLKRNVKVGEDELGKPIWDKEWTKVPNKELKKMVEAYKDKDRDHDRSTMKEKLAEKQAIVAEQKAEYKAPGKSVSRDTTL